MEIAVSFSHCVRHEAGERCGKPHAREFDSPRGYVHEYTEGFIGALCAAFSVGAIAGAVVATFIWAFFFQD